MIPVILPEKLDFSVGQRKTSIKYVCRYLIVCNKKPIVNVLPSVSYMEFVRTLKENTPGEKAETNSNNRAATVIRHIGVNKE